MCLGTVIRLGKTLGGEGLEKIERTDAVSMEVAACKRLRMVFAEEEEGKRID